MIALIKGATTTCKLARQTGIDESRFYHSRVHLDCKIFLKWAMRTMLEQDNTKRI